MLDVGGLRALLNPETGPQWPPMLFLFLSGLQSAKAFSFDNRLSQGDNIIHNGTVTDYQVKS